MDDSKPSEEPDAKVVYIRDMYLICKILRVNFGWGIGFSMLYLMCCFLLVVHFVVEYLLGIDLL